MEQQYSMRNGSDYQMMNQQLWRPAERVLHLLTATANPVMLEQEHEENKGNCGGMLKNEFLPSRRPAPTVWKPPIGMKMNCPAPPLTLDGWYLQQQQHSATTSGSNVHINNSNDYISHQQGYSQEQHSSESNNYFRKADEEILVTVEGSRSSSPSCNDGMMLLPSSPSSSSVHQQWSDISNNRSACELLAMKQRTGIVSFMEEYSNRGFDISGGSSYGSNSSWLTKNGQNPFDNVKNDKNSVMAMGSMMSDGFGSSLTRESPPRCGDDDGNAAEVVANAMARKPIDLLINAIQVAVEPSRLGNLNYASDEGDAPHEANQQISAEMEDQTWKKQQPEEQEQEEEQDAVEQCRFGYFIHGGVPIVQRKAVRRAKNAFRKKVKPIVIVDEGFCEDEHDEENAIYKCSRNISSSKKRSLTALSSGKQRLQENSKMKQSSKRKKKKHSTSAIRSEENVEEEKEEDKFEEVDKRPVIRSKRGRSQTLPSRYRDTVMTNKMKKFKC